MATTSILSLPFDDNLRLIDVIRRGIPARALSTLADPLKLSIAGLAATVAIPPRTLERRLAANATLKVTEAERAVRLARLFAQATDVFEDESEAAAWFREPLKIFRNQTPLELCMTEAGAREVEQTLGRIEHGVFG